MDYTGAEKYEKGWFISSEDAKILFMAKLVKMAEEVASEWNSLSDVEVTVEIFVSMVRMNYSWMKAENIQKVGRDELLDILASTLNLEVGGLHTEGEVREFINRTNVEFWTGCIEFEMPSEFMNIGEGNRVIRTVVEKALGELQ